VRLGDYNIQSDDDGAFPIDIDVKWKKTHERFNSKTLENDISLLKLIEQVPLSETILPICLPLSDETQYKNWTGLYGTVVGWGTTGFRGDCK